MLVYNFTNHAFLCRFILVLRMTLLKSLIDRSSKGYILVLKPYAWGSAKEPLTTSWYDASNTTVKPVFSGTVLSGHSFWSGWLSLRSRNLSDFRINFVLNSHLLIDVKCTSRNFERRWQSLTLLYICFSVELFTIVSQFRILKNGRTFHRIFECLFFFKRLWYKVHFLSENSITHGKLVVWLYHVIQVTAGFLGTVYI